MNPGAVAAWDQVFAGHSERLDRLIASFIAIARLAAITGGTS